MSSAQTGSLPFVISCLGVQAKPPVIRKQISRDQNTLYLYIVVEPVLCGKFAHVWYSWDGPALPLADVCSGGKPGEEDRRPMSGFWTPETLAKTEIGEP
jgi:hypothetical protein